MVMTEQYNLPRRLVAEGLGTALLVASVVGSGIMGAQLADGNAAIALLANTLATGSALIVLILIFGTISGAHFNPVVSLSFSLQRKFLWKDCLAYCAVQIVGGVCGAFLAHMMFDLPLLMSASHVRTGAGVWIGEVIATFALLATILSCARNHPHATPYAVGLVIMAGYWYTSSTSFANPAVTIARSLSDTFSGIRPVDVPAFIVMQIIGAFLATKLFQWFWSKK